MLPFPVDSFRMAMSKVVAARELSCGISLLGVIKSVEVDDEVVGKPSMVSVAKLLLVQLSATSAGLTDRSGGTDGDSSGNLSENGFIFKGTTTLLDVKESYEYKMNS